MTTTPDSTPTMAAPSIAGWQLVWNDEFDGAAGTRLDPAKWQFDTGGEGWGNNEWQYYTDHPENAALDGNGSLAISALELTDRSTSRLNCWYGPCRFTSARLLTLDRFEFTYGRVEARLRLPYGQGMWPAFWLLGVDIPEKDWPGCGEIDIMENIGKEPGNVYGTVHGPGYSGGNGIGQTYTLTGRQRFADDFHVFAVEWEVDEIRWFVDGENYFTLRKTSFAAGKPWVFDRPFFIILNVAVGGNWPGYPDETTTFPQQMLVDYVRVYQRIDQP